MNNNYYFLLNNTFIIILLVLLYSKIKRFALFFIYFTLSNFITFIYLSRNIRPQDINLYSFILDIVINITRATNIINIFSILLNNI
jgi:hypothetical protein